MFGNNTATTTNSTNLFAGNNNSNQTSLFGNNNNTATNNTSLFGSSNSQNTGFGANKPATNSLFGTNAQTTSTSLFGGNNNASKSLFGSNNATNTTNNTKTSLFGNNNNTKTSNSLFGGNNNNSGSLFGNNNNTSTSSSSLFGNNNKTQNNNSLFGNNNNNSNSLLNNSQNNSNVLQNIPEAALPWWLRELIFVQGAYSGGNGSRLCAYMVDKIPDELKIIALSSPAAFEKLKDERKKAFFKMYPWLDERQWNEADKQCPDEYLPTPVIGIEGLCKRVESQVQELNDQISLLKASDNNESIINSTWLNSLKLQCSTQLQGSIEKCKREQRKLDERFINVVGKVEQYLALVSNKKMTEKEANFHDRIIKLREGLKKLSTKSLIVKKKVNANYTDLEERINEESKLLTITKIDNIQEKEMFSLLSSQSKAIERLIKVVRKDMRDLNLIKSKKNSP